MLFLYLCFLGNINIRISFRYDAWNKTWTKLDMELPYDSMAGSAMFVDDNICDNYGLGVEYLE